MSNTCPKCGDIIDTDGIAYKCRSRIHPFEQSHLCEVAETAYNRGRAEAIAELDAWHTVSDVEPSIGNGQCIVVKTQNNHGKWYSILCRVSHWWETDYGEPLSWRDVLLAVNSETTKQWREVRQ